MKFEQEITHVCECRYCHRRTHSDTYKDPSNCVYCDGVTDNRMYDSYTNYDLPLGKMILHVIKREHL